MHGRRTTLVLVTTVALAMAGCGGSSPGASPGASTGASTAPATQAPGGGTSSTPAAGQNLGTMNVDLGGQKYAYPIRVCGFADADLGVIAYTDALGQNSVALAIPGDGSDPSLSGTIDSTPWAVAIDAKATVNGKSGTFSGTDAVSGKAVSGDFACTN